MAGFFGFFNYSKPGPGVSKDMPEKHRFFVFFEIFSRKFWNLIKINMLYFISIILFFVPMILVFVTAHLEGSSYLFVTSVSNGVKTSILNPFIILYALPIGLAGPATAGFTYIMRNFAREEHAFLWMDYKDTIKKNWKQSLAAGLINVVVGMVLVVTIPFYFQNLSTNKMFIIPLAICIMLAIIFVFMHYYLYVLIITFDLKLKQIYKNCAIFALAGFGRNFLLTLAVMFWVLFVAVIPVLGCILLIFLLLSFLGLQINFSTWPLIKKMMIDPYEKKNGTGEEPDSDDEQVFEDRGREGK